MLKPAALIAVAAVLSGCATTIAGTPTWPGAKLDRVLLTEADFPAGVQYGRIVEHPGQPDNDGGPPPMLTSPKDCANGLTNVIAQHAERGPGAAAKYNVIYDGARIVITVLTSPLDLGKLQAEATRCESFKAYFDANSTPIPITTTALPSSRPQQLVYQQTMRLGGIDSSAFMSFENVGAMSVFGIAFPTTQLGPGHAPVPKASLPQTFTEIADHQAQRIQDS